MFLIKLDLSAAVDTVDATLLLKKLDCEFGISGSVHKWFETCVHKRKYFGGGEWANWCFRHHFLVCFILFLFCFVLFCFVLFCFCFCFF